MAWLCHPREKIEQELQVLPFGVWPCVFWADKRGHLSEDEETKSVSCGVFVRGLIVNSLADLPPMDATKPPLWPGWSPTTGSWGVGVRGCSSSGSGPSTHPLDWKVKKVQRFFGWKV